MRDRKTVGGVMGKGIVMLVAGGLLAASAACTKEQPKPLAQPTPDQVRSHADQTFDKLKQEERERAVQPPAAR